MPDVPEHLLARSAARRAALTGGEAPSTAVAAPSAAEPGGSASPAVAAPAAAPAVAAPTEPAFIEPVDRAAYERVVAIKRRRIPAWAMGVLALLPLWGFLYVGAFGTRGAGEAAIDGATLYGSNCAACHGATGGGGVGPKLAGGEAKLTFPTEADHIAWVHTGSAPFNGKPYGDPNRVGGQHIAKTGGMPAFAGKLSEAEIAAIVTYERETL